MRLNPGDIHIRLSSAECDRECPSCGGDGLNHITGACVECKGVGHIGVALAVQSLLRLPKASEAPDEQAIRAAFIETTETLIESLLAGRKARGYGPDGRKDATPTKSDAHADPEAP